MPEEPPISSDPISLSECLRYMRETLPLHGWELLDVPMELPKSPSPLDGDTDA